VVFIMDSFTKNLSGILTFLRNEHGYTIDNIAQKLNKTSRTVQKYEEGSIRVPTDVICDIAAIYGMSVYDFIGLTGRNYRFYNIPHIAKRYFSQMGFYVDFKGDFIVLYVPDTVSRYGITFQYEMETIELYKILNKIRQDCYFLRELAFFDISIDLTCSLVLISQLQPIIKDRMKEVNASPQTLESFNKLCEIWQNEIDKYLIFLNKDFELPVFNHTIPKGLF